MQQKNPIQHESKNKAVEGLAQIPIEITPVNHVQTNVGSRSSSRLASPVTSISETAHTPKPIESEIQEREHIWIPMPDGVRLAARMWMPSTPGKYPCLIPIINTDYLGVLEYIPYGKRHGTAYRDEENYIHMARVGYVCLRVDLRGTGDSEGVLRVILKSK
jgi:predicted acyl esterase